MIEIVIIALACIVFYDIITYNKEPTKEYIKTCELINELDKKLSRPDLQDVQSITKIQQTPVVHPVLKPIVDPVVKPLVPIKRTRQEKSKEFKRKTYEKCQEELKKYLAGPKLPGYEINYNIGFAARGKELKLVNSIIDTLHKNKVSCATV